VAKKLFTDLWIKTKLKAHQSKRLELADGGAPGLYICVQPKPSGAKSFAMRFRRPDGRNARLVLGGFDPTKRDPHKQPQIGASLTLVEARLLAGRIHHERAGGADVIRERKSAKLRQRLQLAAAKDNSFAVLAPRYIAHVRLRTRRWAESARLLGLAYRDGEREPTVIPRGLCELWADRHIGEIDAVGIRAVVGQTITQSAPGLEPRRKTSRAEPMGRALHSALSAFFGWAITEGKIESNPCAKARRPPPSRARERVLSDQELRSIWLASDDLAPQYGALIKLLALTGARLREVGYMKWSELSDDLAMWTLPAARVKNNRAHVARLALASREIIKSVPRLSDEYVLSLGGDQPLESYSRMKRQLDALCGVTDWTLHDLRRTTATGLQKLGVRLEVTERILNHVGSRAGIVGIYQRYSFDAEARQGLEAWAERVAALVAGKEAPSNVVEIAARKTA
jgi:integrase